MPVVVQCSNPDCRASISVADGDIGPSTRCRRCGQAVSLFPSREMSHPPSSDPDPGGPTPHPLELADGSTFGRYRILGKLGRGGMGAVYLALDTHLDRKVALKVPHFLPGDGPEFLQRFYREARAAAGL